MNSGKLGYAVKKHILFSLSLIGSLAVNVVFMQNGNFNITQHLYYLPLLLGVFYYGKGGVYLACLISFLYLLSVIQFDYNQEVLAPTLVRCVILIVIAVLVYSLLKKNRQQEKDLLSEQQWLAMTLLSIGDGVIAADSAGNIRMVNREAELISEYQKETVIGKRIDDVYHIYRDGTLLRLTDEIMGQIKQVGSVVLGDNIYYTTPNGVTKNLDIKISLISLTPKEILGYVIIFRDVTEKKQIEEEIIYLTYHDKLTGLYNRRFFEEELKRLDVVRSYPVSIIIGDVNGLKLANDVFGHLAGDQLLVCAANVMKESCRQEDVVARWGGDEYIILLPNTSAALADQIAERIRQKCSETFVNDVNLSVSLGYSTKNDSSQDIMAVIKQADDLMYKKKLLENRSTKSKAVQAIFEKLHEKSIGEEEHSIRVSELCGKLGEALHFNKSQIADLILMGKFHDIGKASIDADILNKKEGLTPEEHELMKQHAEKGYHILTASPELSYLAGGVLSHHERWDGTGYPNKLKGENIPLMARILNVADSYDSMVATRPYHRAISKEEALQQLVENAGKKYDPEIVRVFVQMMKAV